MTKRLKRKGEAMRDTKVAVKIPIANIPEKFLWMRVNSGTKIRNVINYALKELPGYRSVVWSGAGQGIGKVVTCAEICKRKHLGLHQITKLRYVKSKNARLSTEETDVARSIPEIHILLAKEPLDEKEPGQQSSGEKKGMFSSRSLKISSNEKNCSDEHAEIKCEKKSSTNKLSSDATEEFAAMGLRTGQKRSRKVHYQTSESCTSNKSRKKGKK